MMSGVGKVDTQAFDAHRSNNIEDEF